jgi:arginase
MSANDLSLLLPEWQGCGVDAAAATGARAIADLLGPDRFIQVDAPGAETLAFVDGVLGLPSIAAHAERARDLVRERRPSRIFTVGGTCGAELAPVSYLNDRYHGNLAVVWLDAHADLNTPGTSPSGRFHGMVLRTLLGSGPAPLVRLLPRHLDPTQIVLAGARDLDRDERIFVSNSAITVLSPADLIVPGRVAGRIRACGFTKVYVHLDLDVIDPVEFADVVVPTPGGVSMANVGDVLGELGAAFDVVGFSVVEFRPRSVTALAAVGRLLQRSGIRIGALDATRPNPVAM